MTTAQESVRDDGFIGELVGRLRDDDRVVGLVLAGSSAQPERRDRWSDHDFLLVTIDGAQEEFRTRLDWLPQHEDIGWWFRETPHGLKVLYRSGLLLEFAVFDLAEFASCSLHHFRVVIDTTPPTIADLASEVRDRSAHADPVDPTATFRNFLALVYIGTGRARRGERLSANVLLRDYATGHLLRLFRALDRTGDTTALDHLDPWRRVEGAWPELAGDLDSALSRPVTEVGAALLDVAEGRLPSIWADWPASDLDLVRDLLVRDLRADEA